jgi:hypothetical protein
VGAFGSPSVAAGTSRVLPIPQSGCDVPQTARGYSLNVTAVPPDYLSFVTVWPAGLAQSFVSTLNSWNGQVVANGKLVPAGTKGAISLYAANQTGLVRLLRALS